VGDYGTGFTDFGTGEAIQQTLAHNTDFGQGLFLRVFSRIIFIFTIFHLLPLALALVIHGIEYAFDV
jgi:hypothetical protein